MTQETWTAVDRLFDDVIASDAALESARTSRTEAGMPQIEVAPNQGKLLHILARAIGAQRILEVGTLAGYSAIWLARALPPAGRLVTLELDETRAEVARANIARAGLTDRVTVRVGPALESLDQLAGEGAAPFDFTFIDADKATTAEYFTRALELSRPGSLIVVDNVVRHGGVLDAGSSDASVQGMLRFNQVLAAERRVTATVVQTVGVKGYDGFSIALVTESG